jgi:hypothetical protein
MNDTLFVSPKQRQRLTEMPAGRGELQQKTFLGTSETAGNNFEVPGV